jgi:hypothetical protein
MDNAMPLLEVGLLCEIPHHVEQEGVVEDVEVIPVAVAGCLLIGVFVASEQLTWRRCS